MRKLDATVPHRLGRRTNFIPSLEGPKATWSDVIDTATEPPRLAATGEAATATLLTVLADEQPLVATADVEGLKELVPDDLLEVRRPATHKGMTNYISRVAVPSQQHKFRSMWCESFNELSHLRDLMLTKQPEQVTTQPCRLEWVLSTGVRAHVPDFLIRTREERLLLVDVTTGTKLGDPRLRAILRLTQATAHAAGWDYQVRTELPSQRVRNLNFLHAGRYDVDHDRLAGARLLREAAGQIDVQRASELLGGTSSGYPRLWDLINQGLVHVALDEPIERDSLITFEAQIGGAPWLHAL